MTAEALTRSGWKTLSPTFKNTFYVSCVVQIDAVTFLITGGQQSAADPFSKNTFIYTPSSGSIVAGPPMRQGRWAHGCGRIRTCETSTRISTIVSAGYSSLVFQIFRGSGRSIIISLSVREVMTVRYGRVDLAVPGTSPRSTQSNKTQSHRRDLFTSSRSKRLSVNRL